MTRRSLLLLTLFVIATTLCAALVLNAPLMYAEVMNSTSYKIDRDSINFGGGLSASGSYSSESTMGEIATGDSSSNNFRLRAGYQQMKDAYLSITAADDVLMDPALGGVTGGTSNGSTTVIVTTDSAAGYQLFIKASSTPAMQGNTHGSSIANYTPAGDPDFTFTVPATSAEFGFSPEGGDIVQKYKDDGVSTCNTSSSDTQYACWNALTTSNETISSRVSSNHPAGTETKVRFRITLGVSQVTIADTYTATTTLTALAL